MEIESAQNISCLTVSDPLNMEDGDDFYPMTEAQKSAFERTIRQAQKYTIDGENWYKIPLTEDDRKYYKSLLSRSSKGVKN